MRLNSWKTGLLWVGIQGLAAGVGAEASIWNEVELAPRYQNRFRTMYDWHRNGFVTDIPRLVTQSGLNTFQKPNNLIQFITTEARLQLNYRWVEVQLGLFDHRIVGGDAFSMDDLELSENYFWLGKDWTVQLKVGRQIMQVGHELVIGFEDWSVSPEFYDSANVLIVFDPFVLEIFNNQILDKSTLAFLTLKETLLFQPQFVPTNADLSFADTDLRGLVGRLQLSQTDWIHGYWVHSFNLNPFVGFNEFAFFKSLGVAYRWHPWPWLRWDGEGVYQYGKYTRQLDLSAMALYQRVRIACTLSPHFTVYPSLAVWLASGDEKVFATRVSTGLPGDNGRDIRTGTDGKYKAFVFVRPDLHSHLGITDLIGLSNVFSVSAALGTAFTLFSSEHSFATELAGYGYWIQNTRGLVRNAKGFALMVAPGGTRETFIGTEIDLQATYHYDVLTVALAYGVFVPGAYARAFFWKHEAGKSDPQTVSLLSLDLTLTL
jgi:hypothetical protein